MQQLRGKIFSESVSWQQSHQPVLAIYRHASRFPYQEKLGLPDQMRRVAVSITSNIAEGFSRLTYTDKKRFYAMAHGSLAELQNQLLIARDVVYLTEGNFRPLTRLVIKSHKLLNGLIKATQKRLDS